MQKLHNKFLYVEIFLCDHLINSKFRLNNCHWPFNGLNITVDGIATPCCIRMDPKIHNLENLMNLDNFEDLWNGPKYIELRKAHINKDLNNLMCGACPN